jgi:AmmeMemoRadiSam system protein A
VPPRLRLPQAAFVTLRSAGGLRGCIGTLAADRALAEAVAGCAVAAALEDPRFPPLRHGELAGIRFEISALGLLVPAPDPGVVVPGRHGVVISLGRRRGLLLPQVAEEEGWDRDTFLMHACRKAGLPDDAWQGAARIEVFEAEVFSEDDPA